MSVKFPLFLDEDGCVLDANLKTVVSKHGGLTAWVRLIHTDAELEEINQAVASVDRTSSKNFDRIAWQRLSYHV